MNTVDSERVWSPEALADERLAGLVGTKSLALWRSRGEGPAFVRVGGRKLAYLESDVVAWLKSSRVQR